VQLLTQLHAFFGPCKLRDITPVKIEEYRQARVKEVSPATSNREMALLKHIFNMAERWGQHYGTNPVRLVKFLPEDNLRIKILSDQEEKALLAFCPPYPQDMIVFGLNTGLRAGDIFNLKWEEVDLERQWLNILVQKTRRL
jgi:integrase